MLQKKFYDKVYEIVKQIPSGKVATYKQIATVLHKPNYSRQVGFALHNNPNPNIIPCHRVVNSKGMIAKGFAFGGKEMQKHLLQKEGVVINNNKIDLNYYQFKFL